MARLISCHREPAWQQRSIVQRYVVWLSDGWRRAAIFMLRSIRSPRQALARGSVSSCCSVLLHIEGSSCCPAEIHIEAEQSTSHMAQLGLIRSIYSRLCIACMYIVLSFPQLAVVSVFEQVCL